MSTPPTFDWRAAEQQLATPPPAPTVSPSSAPWFIGATFTLGALIWVLAGYGLLCLFGLA